MRENVLIHSDLNCFYASVEMLLDPFLRGKAVAVCGSTESRHGIVLAKSDRAKKAGVKTGMANWEARKVCPELIMVPPQYREYVHYSHLVRDIYKQYTNRVEPFGMDECWCNLTGSAACCETAYKTAENIRARIREEIGLTVSIGVSFSKVFAKLGSDMKKPDAVTLISVNNYRDKVWPLPVGELIYIGRATTAKLHKYNIDTIGDLANADSGLLKKTLGVNGEKLWLFANGMDGARVAHEDYSPPPKSIGHGITCTEDLRSPEQVWRVILALSQQVGERLRQEHLAALGLQVVVRGADLKHKQYQTRLPVAMQGSREIANAAFELFEKTHNGKELSVRAVTVRAIALVSDLEIYQTSLFCDNAEREKLQNLEAAIDKIRARYGEKAIYNACLMGDIKMPDDGRHAVTLPDLMYV